MTPEATVLVVTAEPPPGSLIAKLEAAGLFVEVTSPVELLAVFPMVAPDLVVHIGAHLAPATVHFLLTHDREHPTRLVLLGQRAELANLRRLDRHVVQSVLAFDIPERLIVERILDLARRALSGDGAVGEVTAIHHERPTPPPHPATPEEKLRAWVQSSRPPVITELDAADENLEGRWESPHDFAPYVDVTPAGESPAAEPELDPAGPDATAARAGPSSDEIEEDERETLVVDYPSLALLPPAGGPDGPDELRQPGLLEESLDRFSEEPAPLDAPAVGPTDPGDAETPSFAAAAEDAAHPLLLGAHGATSASEVSPALVEPPRALLRTEEQAPEARLPDVETGAQSASHGTNAPTVAVTPRSAEPLVAPRSRSLGWLAAAVVLAAGAGGLWKYLSPSGAADESPAPHVAHDLPRPDQSSSSPAALAKDAASAPSVTAAAPHPNEPSLAATGAATDAEMATETALSPEGDPFWTVRDDPAVVPCDQLVADTSGLRLGDTDQSSQLWKRARGQLLLGDLKSALVSLCSASWIQPAGLVTEALIEHLLTLQAPTAAKPFMQRALSDRPRRPKTLELAGDLECQLGRPVRARELWLEALGIHSPTEATLRQIARQLVAQAVDVRKGGQVGLAERLYRRAAILDESNNSAWLGLTEIARSRGATDLATRFEAKVLSRAAEVR